jgi:hypothetical protein
MLNHALLNDYMKVFYGYGSWKAKYWFVGIEEGGGKTFEEVTRRLDTWDRRGRRDIEDIREFHGQAQSWRLVRKYFADSIDMGISHPRSSHSAKQKRG